MFQSIVNNKVYKKRLNELRLTKKVMKKIELYLFRLWKKQNDGKFYNQF